MERWIRSCRKSGFWSGLCNITCVLILLLLSKVSRLLAMSPLFLSKSHSADNKQAHMGPIVLRRRRTQTAAVQDMRWRYNRIKLLYKGLWCEEDSRGKWGKIPTIKVPVTVYLTCGRGTVHSWVNKYPPKGGMSQTPSKIYLVVDVDLQTGA